ncbi:unnamed protein product [Tuber melanosporum]|uniref:(Perigord truffle) hypothetical protein n=1 Tax=Tuber melanosporum (strain Mel28) TaxID=656061 RepID=D5G6N3_TUBMM|nr:uncharacterized protein GSTUM_00002139001 [Tuber melanosporum]CAZ80176.1 unnamed protein product [Tuber melanosporum]
MAPGAVQGLILPRELTKCLLHRDFGLNLALPSDRLCPTVPNRFRLNYVLWIQDLLDSTGNLENDEFDSTREVVGLDVGTGASCIYPLLGCALRDGWKFIATDIDGKSLEYARENVRRNKEKVGDLDERIMVLDNSPDDDIFPVGKLGIEMLDFTMCNPPFYASIDDMLDSARQKDLPPSSACTGTTTEMVCPGGETSFVALMLNQSLQFCSILGFKNTWYTSMLGKRSSVESLVPEIKLHTQNYAITEFKQGSTRRWGVAWSFGDRRPCLAAARYESSQLRGLMPFPTEFEFDAAGDVISVGWGTVKGNVWSRAARRAKARGLEMEGVSKGIVLGFRVGVKEKEDQSVKVRIRWTRGTDSVLFESFCGMIKRKILGR